MISPVHFQGSDTEAHLELRLPQKVSCNEAELAVIAAIDANTTVYGKAFVEGHSGAALLKSEKNFETWVVINPASPHWFGITKDGPSAAFNGANREAFSKVTSKEPNDNSNGDGNDEDEKELDVAAPVKGKGRLGSVRDEERRGLSSFN
ncbi:hypothetical protein C8Q70DRAFT_438622 [Cubamyces menziesii]|nr:hypothetical protein C8Q70DRAFT_438622 [Cubamyces menziesii]